MIHQPRYSIFTLFDETLLLAKGGLAVYLGWSSEALPYVVFLNCLLRCVYDVDYAASSFPRTAIRSIAFSLTFDVLPPTHPLIYDSYTIPSLPSATLSRFLLSALPVSTPVS